MGMFACLGECNGTAASIAGAHTKTGTGFKELGGQEREQDQLAC